MSIAYKLKIQFLIIGFILLILCDIMLINISIIFYGDVMGDFEDT
jgi:hypothetical protein